VKYIAEFNAKEKHREANEIFSSSSILQGAVGLLGFIHCCPR